MASVLRQAREPCLPMPHRAVTYLAMPRTLIHEFILYQSCAGIYHVALLRLAIVRPSSAAFIAPTDL